MTLPRSWRGASQGHQTAPSPLMATTSQAPRTCVHSHAQHSFLPAFIFRSNKHCSPDIQPAKHSPRLNWGRPCHSSTLQHTSTSTRASPLNPRAACSPPTPLRNLQILFLPVTHCAQKWPHPSALTPTKDPKTLWLITFPTCRSHSPSASRHTHGLSRNSPALAR